MTSAKRLFSGVSLSCRRGSHMLFQNLSFGLEAGSVLHLGGANGTGKTSLLRMMSGLLSPIEGKIVWEDESIAENERAHAARLSFLPVQDIALKSSETSWDNLRFWAQLWGLRDMEVIEAMETMGVVTLKDKLVRHLSAGQKRRINLARTIMKKAPLWLADEPFIALDPEGAMLFRQALHKHTEKGGVVVIASHQSFGLQSGAYPHTLLLGAA